MLGRYIHVRVTHPIHTANKQTGQQYPINYGVTEGTKRFDYAVEGAYILGVDKPVRSFDGRVIAVLRRKSGKGSHAEERALLVVSPKNVRFIDNEIADALAFAEVPGSYTLDCLYENSCGAVVYRIINDEPRFLLIRNKCSAHWGFPKGHMEPGETAEETAIREVLEEAGIRIQLLPDFFAKSEYTIQGRVEKSVTLFLAKTPDTSTTIQREEIEDYLWLSFDKAVETLRFENDRGILRSANNFLLDNKYI